MEDFHRHNRNGVKYIKRRMNVSNKNNSIK